MKKRQYARKPAPDTSVMSAGNLLQTRPFQADSINQQTPQVQKESEALTGGFDLTKQYLLNPPTTVSDQPLQAKLTIGQPNDKYEQEADRVAHDVVQQINSPQQTGTSGVVQKLDDKQVQRQELEEEDEDVLQAKLESNIVQRDELDEDEDELQMKPDRVQLQSEKSSPQNLIQADFESNLNQAKRGGSPLDPVFRAKVEPVMGADFSGVRVHTDKQSNQLNQSIQAKAFTTGQDVFFRQGAYQPNSRGGQELIAHELTHVIQQKGSAVLHSRLQPFKDLKQRGVDTIQRQFQPVTITDNAHLRNDGDWGTYVGSRIDSGSEIVVDQAQQKTQNHAIGSDTTWTKAVNVTGEHWDWTAHGGRTTYIRNSRIGTAKQYPQRTGNIYKPQNRQSTETPRLNWHHLTGEFVEIEDSVSTPNSKIAFHKGSYKRVDPVAGQVASLDAQERLQLDTNAFEQYLFNRLRAVLTNATNGMAWQNLLVTDPNLRKIMYSANDGSKALRFDDLGKNQSGRQFVAYYRWVTDPNGPFERIREGAEYVRDSLEHWRQWLYPPQGTGVSISSISLSGSDLHESGLGVMFVTFNKANEGRNADYYGAGDYQVVVKPEERDLEQKLFGTDNASLANTVNTGVGLAGNDQITTYKQKVDSGFGTLCERVVGTQAKDLPNDQIRPITQAMKESLVFVLITGLTDLHGENILWNQGKPYLIDADNALKLQYMTPNQATAQNGYVAYSNTANDVLREVYASSVGYETAIMQALTNPGTPEERTLLMKVKQVFGSSMGRTVPIETSVWGQRLKYAFILCQNEGLNTDVAVQGQEPTTKWQWCDKFAASVPTGEGAHAPGLIGEVGRRGGTDGNFQRNVEKAQLYADFKVGQIPFYNYQYGTGNVLHNGQVIWNGQTINERMQGLFNLFPQQLDIV